MTQTIPRRQQILNALAQMLKESPGEHITTSALAKSVGVSEAALYRHFPSKTKMFEGLIDFIEESIFSQISQLLDRENNYLIRCEVLVANFLFFVEENPGMSRLLVGDVLTGEAERLRVRLASFFERIEAQLKAILLEAEINNKYTLGLSSIEFSHFLMVYIDGCILQFVRTQFQRRPSAHWAIQWQQLLRVI
jgi:TetR/AcrR family transcriptional regulator